MPLRDIPVDQMARRLSQASLDDKEKRYAQLSIRSIGDHLLYEAMYQVFLNRRSFYLVVLNLVDLCNPEGSEKALTKVDLWLNSIHVHTAQTMPIFFIKTTRSQVGEEDLSRAEKVLYDELIDWKLWSAACKKEESFFVCRRKRPWWLWRWCFGVEESCWRWGLLPQANGWSTSSSMASFWRWNSQV